MRRVALGIAMVLMVALPLLAQAPQTVRGKVTAVTGNSITVNVDGKDMMFAVDASTKVTAPGAGTAAREKAKEGAKPEFASLVKVGENVEVRYNGTGTAMTAVSIRTVGSAGSAPAASTKSARGTVSAVTADSLTVKEPTGETTFAIDTKTMVEGTGVGTKARAMKAEGEGTHVNDFVAVNDTVVVRYTETDGKKVASSVRIMEKGKK